MTSFLFSLVWGSWIGRITAAVLIGLVALKANNLYQRHEGKAEVIQQSEKQGTKNNEEAARNRSKLNDDKYFDRMFKRYCRDC